MQVLGPLTAFGEPLESPDVVLSYLVRLDARATPIEDLPRFALRLTEIVGPPDRVRKVIEVTY